MDLRLFPFAFILYLYKMLLRKAILTFPVFLVSFTLFSQGTWVQKASLPAAGRSGAVAFSIGAKGYLGTGIGLFAYFEDFWEYDPSTNSWTQKANFGGGFRELAVGFSIGNYGYVGTGAYGPTKYNDFWQYDPGSNVWSQVANVGGNPRATASGFSVGGNGYLGTGSDGSSNFLNDLWKYDPANNIWVQQGSFIGGGRMNIGQACFTIGNKAYWGTGDGGTGNDFWEYDPIIDSWTQKTNLPGFDRIGAMGFSICNKGFLGLGVTSGNTIFINDLWVYNPVLNSWTAATPLPASARWRQPSFVVNNKAYIGTGEYLTTFPFPSVIYFADFWEFEFQPIVNISASSSTLCIGEATTLTATGALDYSWSPGGQTASSIVVNPTTSMTYTVMGSDSCASNTSTSVLTVFTHAPASISSHKTICFGQNSMLTVYGSGNYLWNTGSTSNSIYVSPTATAIYSVVSSDICGSDTLSSVINVMASPVSQFSFFTSNVDSCLSLSTIEFINSSTNSNSSFWDFGDGGMSSLPNPTHTYSSGGIYSATLVSNTYFGCTDTSKNIITIEEYPSQPLQIPNAFSPNGDNENDSFHAQRINCIQKFSLAIYNRFGEKLFETTNPLQGWDGACEGEKENPGVYAYYLYATLISGDLIQKKGNVSLMR